MQSKHPWRKRTNTLATSDPSDHLQVSRACRSLAKRICFSFKIGMFKTPTSYPFSTYDGLPYPSLQGKTNILKQPVQKPFAEARLPIGLVRQLILLTDYFLAPKYFLQQPDFFFQMHLPQGLLQRIQRQVSRRGRSSLVQLTFLAVGEFPWRKAEGSDNGQSPF